MPEEERDRLCTTDKKEYPDRLRSAGITVFLALLLGSMTALVCAGMLSVQMACARTQIQNGVDIGLFSLFGEYDRDLLEKYDLFFLDGGWGGSRLDLAAVYGEFRKYMDPVLSQNNQTLQITQGGFTGYRLATDEGGESLFRQAVSFMREKQDAGTERPGSTCDLTPEEVQRMVEKGMELEQKDYFRLYQEEIERAAEESRRKAAKEMEDQILTDGTAQPDPGSLVFLNPLFAVQRLSETGALEWILPEGGSISASSSAEGELLSQRPVEEGLAVLDSLAADDTEEGNGLFSGYLMEKLNNFRNPAEVFPYYQLEYVLAGHPSDLENIKEIASEILLFREGMNQTAVMLDQGMREKISQYAREIVQTYLVPPSQEAVEQAVRYAFILGESLLETRMLLLGERMAPEKSGRDFILSLEELENIEGLLRGIGDTWTASSDGILYEDMLLLMLKKTGKREKLVRGMDVIEQVIRAERPDFRLSNCLSDVEIFVDVQANLKKTFSVRRVYGYS